MAEDEEEEEGEEAVAPAAAPSTWCVLKLVMERVCG